MKKIINFGLTIVLAITLCMPYSEVNAAQKKYKAAYKKVLSSKKFVKKYINDISYLELYFGKDCVFNRYYYYDLDKNGIPELFIYSSKMHLTEIFTYKKGKIIDLGYYDIYGINKKKREIVIHGHWHGASGSGVYEWSTFKLNSKKNKLYMNCYIDQMEYTEGTRWTIYQKGEFVTVNNKSAYKRRYKEHIKGTMKIKEKMKKLSNQF